MANNPPNDFVHSRKALEIYDSEQPAIADLFARAETNEDVEAAVAAQTACADKVRVAFYEDTKAYNSLEDCMRIHPTDIKSVVKYVKANPEGAQK